MDESKHNWFRGRGSLDLRERTKQFAIRIVRMYTSLPKKTEALVIGKQVLRSGTSVGAQFREACRAKSDADFISKVGGSLQELEETQYWLELLVELELIKPDRLTALISESEELLRILVSIATRTKKRVEQSELEGQ
jgi:four helix bundle protein